MGNDMGKINIFVEGWLHFKNEIGMNLMKSDKIEFHKIKNPNINYDWIMNLSEFKDYDIDNNTGLIFGPQIMFPAIDINQIPSHRRYFCNVLSNWVYDLCKDINPSVNFCTLPFAVDVDRFRPSEKNGKPIIYFKQRNPEILIEVLDYLKKEHIVINYNGLNSYNESYFEKVISEAPYAIWIGRHESQGFAFQEILSSNTPMFVIDCKSLRDEFTNNSFWQDYLPEHSLPATSASYFDENCGIVCYLEDWKKNFDIFISNLSTYNPRKFILENLSPDACVSNWHKTLCNIKNEKMKK